jgi:hypothetical protein
MDTQKLLYILPDVAYLAELIPGKKEHTYVVHSFRQINGEFIDENELIAANVIKLFSKLSAETYHLVLPDFLFTNTIVEIKEKSENKVKEYIKQTLLPELDLSASTHVLKPFILNQYGDKSRIQLSAIEKSVLAPIVKGAQDAEAIISSVTPLSWTIKSLISLEPSISIVQMGSRGYLALHYIGVDQAHDATIDDIETLAETIKTLKGGEPSIQTVYLLTNDLIEEKIKENLDGVVPVQQLTNANNDSDMPSYVQQVIEAGMKSLSIAEYAVPTFTLPKFAEIEEFLLEQPKDTQVASAEAKVDEIDEQETTESLEDERSRTMPAIKELSLDEDDEVDVEPKPESEEESVNSADLNMAAIATSHMSDLPNTDEVSTDAQTIKTLDTSKSSESSKTEPKSLKTEPASNTESDTPSNDDNSFQALAAFSRATISEDGAKLESTTQVGQVKPVIKNKSVVQPMLKMFFISLSVFFATVGIGIAIGATVLGMNMFSPFMQTRDKDSTKQTQIDTPQDSAEKADPSPTPEPTPEPEALNIKELSVLVVNATTKAGYAGLIQKSLAELDFKQVNAGNAKGEYESGLYLLVGKDFTQTTELLAIINKHLQKKFTIKGDKTIEDATNKYDIVVVLAE